MLTERIPIDRTVGDWVDVTRLFQPMPGHPGMRIIQREWRASDPDAVQLTGIGREEFEAIHRICQVCLQRVGDCTCAEPTFDADPGWDQC